MSEKFTPGPWIAEYQGPETKDGWAILTERGWGLDFPWIASAQGTHVSCGSKEEVAANARLISAAPDMYQALRFVREHCQLYGAADAARERIDAALAKAGGGR